MLRRHLQPAAIIVASSATSESLRHCSYPGWQSQSSTRDQRSREQREVERRNRQLEKLPRPELLHDFQFPFEKRVLCDTWFQPPVYHSELDTPRLFNHYPPNDFFLYFNAADFQRTQLPPVPDVDFRKLSSSSSSTTTTDSTSNNTSDSASKDFFTWKRHTLIANQYLRKHEVVPHLIPNVDHSINLSVVFGTSSTNRDELTRENFWKTSLYGNFMELKESHFVKEVEREQNEDEAEEDEAATKNSKKNGSKSKKSRSGGVSRFSQPREVPVRDETATPSIFLSTAPTQKNTSTNASNDQQLYTLLIVSPDYPCRAEPNETFFLHYAVCNLKPSSSSSSPQTPIDVTGKEVVSYVPPLPTEDAGCARVLCVLFPQEKEFDVSKASSSSSKDLPFEKRCVFRLHSGTNNNNNSNNTNNGIYQLEHLIDPTTASACTFFQTSWDIQTQEFYEARNLPEPRYYPEDITALLEYNALPRDFTQVSSRHNAYGGVQEDEVIEQFDKLVIGQNTVTAGISRHTLLSKDGRKIIRPLQIETNNF